jgi:peptide-methionine (S)-S-oxide reductase
MKYLILIQLITFSFTSLDSCSQQKNQSSVSRQSTYSPQKNTKVAYFASGCFWCVEAIFESVDGVDEVISGYIGGKADRANYDDVSSGYTDHAESVKIFYDSTKIDYNTLLKVFFGSHDPTTLNRQGPDFGRQYRSAIFYNNSFEKKLAEGYIEKLYEDNIFQKGTITTEIAELDAFYPAEDYHQDFEKRNPNQSYIRAVSIPRLKKFQKAYPELLKKNMSH